MTPLDLARILLSKARQDLEAMEVLIASDVADEIVGFHAQQAVEKALKAVLTAADVRVGRTHDIAFLLSLFPVDMDAPGWLNETTSLAPYAVIARYAEVTPDERLDRDASASLVHRVIVWAAAHLSDAD